MSGQTFYRDKPYVFIPFQDNATRHKPDASNSYYKAILGECGTLEVTLKAITPLHFGQGSLSIDKKQKIGLVHAIARQNGEVALPGSSFKGMLRSFFEAVSNSCILSQPDMGFSKYHYSSSSRKKCNYGNGYCPACSVFGSLGKKGKLKFTSFLVNGNATIDNYQIPQLESPFRDYPSKESGSEHWVEKKYGNERLYYGDFEDLHGTDIGNLTKSDFFLKKDNKIREKGQDVSFYGRKFYKHSQTPILGKDDAGNTFECLQPGTELKGYIHYEGLSKEELSQLAFSLGLGWKEQIYYKIGYAKPAYYGSISLHVGVVSPKPRYEDIGSHCDINELINLAKDYRKSADDSVIKAILAFEKIWTSTDGPSQWKQSGQGNLTY